MAGLSYVHRRGEPPQRGRVPGGHPDLEARRDRAAAALGLPLASEADVLARLREVALTVGKDYVLVFTPENTPYAPLFGDDA
ncbi:hypothetical protein ACGFNQ_25355 [Streptomyces asoensis]|uniref:hypothetical protein n=1 Tax=Streptomyces asoensis TaxID=249586 RepID=UPI003716CE28